MMSFNVYLLGMIINGFSSSWRFPSVRGISKKLSQSSLKDTLWSRAKSVKLLEREREKEHMWNVNDNHVRFGNFAFPVRAWWPNICSFWMKKTDGKLLIHQLDLCWCLSFLFQGFEVFFFHSPGVVSEKGPDIYIFLNSHHGYQKILRPNKYTMRNSVLVVNFQWSMKENVFMWPDVCGVFFIFLAKQSV